MKKNVPKNLQASASLFVTRLSPVVSKSKNKDCGYIFKGILF